MAEQLLHQNVKRLRGGLVFQSRRRLYHSTSGLRAIKKRGGTEALLNMLGVLGFGCSGRFLKIAFTQLSDRGGTAKSLEEITEPDSGTGLSNRQWEQVRSECWQHAVRLD